MEVYLVGGAVRDELVGYPVQERDWVVVGETPEAMIKRGFKPVGKDFPVFLHPQTHEEYALARMERKTAQGYKGFSVDSSPAISLEEDLLRRDLTINAIAQDSNKDLVDPFNGKEDIEARLLRHVSPAFREDPVRILRVARFKARYHHLGFNIAKQTMDLMKQMVTDGEVNALVAERVWAETLKALSEKSPSQFFLVLRQCHALNILFPEIDCLFGVPQTAKYHPEIDTGIHTMMALEQVVNMTDDTRTRFAVLTHDLGKGLTPKAMLPSHRGHEESGLDPLKALCERLRVPNNYVHLAQQVLRYHLLCHRAFELKPAKLVDTLRALNAFRKENSLKPFITACEADAKGRKGLEQRRYPQGDFLVSAQQAAMTVDTSALVDKGLKDKAFGLKLRELRIARVTAFKRNYSPPGK